MKTAYCIESEAFDAEGKRRGMFRLYVATAGRAQEIADAAPGRRVVPMAIEDVPEKARENLLRAERERLQAQGAVQ